MTRLYRIFLALWLLNLSLVAALNTTPETTIEQRLHSSVQNYAISAENLLQALAKVSDDFQLPMGIEWELSSVPYHPVKLAYASTTPWQILQDLVAVEPPYSFGVANGVVHVSKDALFHDSRNFLNISIDNFQLSSEYVFHANNRLRRLVPELVGSRPVLEKQGGCAGSFGVGAGDQKATFHMQNVTVRDILDRFVTSAGFNIWMATFPEIKTTTPKGFFKNISILSPNLPDVELPAWDLLYPGYDPARKQFGPGWKRGEWPMPREK